MIELIVENIDGKIYEISDITTDITYTSTLMDQPSKLEIGIKGVLPISNGSVVRFKYSSQNIFYGYVFSINGVDESENMNLVCYDQLRYLKNTDILVFGATTLDERFSTICNMIQLKHQIVTRTGYKLPSQVFDEKTYYNMLNDGIDNTLVNTGNWFIIYDDFGTLKLNELQNLKLPILIGDMSRASSYSYEESIDEDTFNSVKIIQEVTNKNSNTKTRSIHLEKDDASIRQIGLLQMTKKVNENYNSQQIRELAINTLKTKNRPTKKFSIPSCIGDTRVRGGTSVVVNIGDLKDRLPMNKYYLVSSVKHTFGNNKHVMALELLLGES